MSSEKDAGPIDPVAQTMEAMAAIHTRTEQRVSRHQRLIETLTGFIGRPGFYYGVLVVVVVWIAVNMGQRLLGALPWDTPPFFWLQGLIGLSALLTTIIVLITQNRQGQIAERRAQLDLQVNLLAEQKVAKLIALVEELRRDLPSVRNRHDPEAEAMKASANPEAVLDALEEALSPTNGTAQGEANENTL